MIIFAFAEQSFKLGLCLSLCDMNEILASNISTVSFTLFIMLTFTLSFENVHRGGGVHKGSHLHSLDQPLIGWVPGRMRIQGYPPACIQEPVALTCLQTVEMICFKRF